MNKISTKHFMFFIFATCTIALRSYSSLFVRVGGRDTWISAFFASILIIFFIIYLLKICSSTNTYDINEILLNSVPHSLSGIVKAIFAFGLFLTAIESSSVEASSIHTNFFLSTPIWYCLLFFIIPASFVLFKKLNSILILIIITVVVTLLGDISLIVLVGKYLDFDYLLPVLGNGINKNILTSVLMILGSLSSIAITLPFLKFITNKKGLLTDTTLATIVSSLLIITSFVSITTFFGPERAGNIFYPEYIESQRIQIASFFEFGELFYIFRSVCMFFLKYILSSYGIILLYKDIIKNKTIFVICYSIIIFIASWYVTLNQYYMFYILKLFQLVLLIPFIVIPLICFSIYALKKKAKLM